MLKYPFLMIFVLRFQRVYKLFGLLVYKLDVFAFLVKVQRNSRGTYYIPSAFF